MNDFETNPRGTMKAMHQASVRLASMKAQWQAEALEAHAQGWISTHRCDEMFAARTIHDVLLSEAQKLRRQAEETV